MPYERLRILVPLDGSADAESILPAIAPLARSLPVTMTLLHALPRDTSDKPANRDLDRVKLYLESRAVRVKTRVDWGEPARMITWEARPGRYDMVAMTSHGRTGLRRLVVGSVAEAVLRNAEIPVLVARPRARLGEWKRIVVALDGSPWSEEILDDGISLARKLGATVHLVHAAVPVWVPKGPEGDFAYADDKISYLCGICERLGNKGVTAMPVLRPLPSSTAILDTARDLDAGLVCMTTHGRSGLARTLMGSTAEEVMRRATCPVLARRVVPAPAPVG